MDVKLSMPIGMPRQKRLSVAVLTQAASEKAGLVLRHPFLVMVCFTFSNPCGEALAVTPTALFPTVEPLR